MTRSGSVLPIPDDSRIQRLIDEWPNPLRWPFRSRWLRDMEQILGEDYLADGIPNSSRERNLTARSLAPFPLLEHDWL